MENNIADILEGELVSHEILVYLGCEGTDVETIENAVLYIIGNFIESNHSFVV